MSGAEAVFIVAFVGWCTLRKVARNMEKTCSQTQTFTFPVEIQRDTQAELRDTIRAIEEEVDVINKTKDPETGLRCFATIRRRLAQLAAEAPSRARMSMLLGGREICRELVIGSGEEAETIAKLEREWLKGFFCEKIETLMKQSEDTQDPVLRTEYLRDALRAAHKGLEYLPDESILPVKAGLAEARLKALTSSDGEQRI